MKNRLKNKLRAHYQCVPPMPDPGKMEETMLVARGLPPAVDDAPPLWRLLVSQLGFVRKKLWGMQALIVLGCVLALYCLPGDAKALAFVSAAAPLVMLTNVFELSRSYTHGMVEIELSTRYSFRQLMIARLCVLGLVDLLCLGVLLVVSGVRLSLQVYALALYVLVPFLLTCFVCLLVINRVRRKECNYCCAAAGLLVSAGVGFIAVQYPQIYDLTAVLVWLGLFFAVFVGMGFEIRNMLKQCGQKLDLTQPDGI